MKNHGPLYRRRKTPTTDEHEIGAVAGKTLVALVAMMLLTLLILLGAITPGDIGGMLHFMRSAPVEFRKQMPPLVSDEEAFRSSSLLPAR